MKTWKLVGGPLDGQTMECPDYMPADAWVEIADCSLVGDWGHSGGIYSRAVGKHIYAAKRGGILRFRNTVL